MSSIENRKLIAGYQPTWRRNACYNCGHVRRDASEQDIGKASFTCEKHHFFVERMALCLNWEARK